MKRSIQHKDSQADSFSPRPSSIQAIWSLVAAGYCSSLLLFLRTAPKGSEGLHRLSCLLSLQKRCCTLHIIPICKDLNCRQSELNCPSVQHPALFLILFCVFLAPIWSLACLPLPKRSLLEVKWEFCEQWKIKIWHCKIPVQGLCFPTVQFMFHSESCLNRFSSSAF